jgi:galactokinase
MARRYRITSQVSVDQNRSSAAGVNRSDVYRADAPGRVNLIGEHTDYNEGLVLPTATPQRTVVELSPREDRVVRVESDGYMPIAYRLGEERHHGDWGDYVRGVTWVLTKTGHAIRGFDAGVASRVPPGAGLSSSAALEVALLRALREAFSLTLDDLALAYAAHKAEREIVGVRVGTMDQLAASLSRVGEALLIDMRKSQIERIPMPASLEIAVVDSGIVHDNAKQGAYNERRAQCDEAARRLGLTSLRDATLADVERLAPHNATLARRVRHVVTENDRVRQFVAALATGDLARCGAIVDASHASLREDFDVSNEELDALADALRSQRGIHGARLVGAGFGGSVLALAEAGCAAEAARGAAELYRSRTGRTGHVVMPV